MDEKNTIDKFDYAALIGELIDLNPHVTIHQIAPRMFNTLLRNYAHNSSARMMATAASCELIIHNIVNTLYGINDSYTMQTSVEDLHEIVSTSIKYHLRCI